MPTDRDAVYAQFADAMIAEKAQRNRDALFLVPAAVRDTGRALERLRDVIRFGSIQTSGYHPDPRRTLVGIAEGHDWHYHHIGADGTCTSGSYP